MKHILMNKKTHSVFTKIYEIKTIDYAAYTNEIFSNDLANDLCSKLILMMEGLIS